MKTGIFISGTGTNMEAVLENFKNSYFSSIEEISFVFSDREAAAGLLKAEKYGIKTLSAEKMRGEKRADYERRVLELISPFDTELLILAGFLKILSPYFLGRYRGDIINIHPSLLPSFPGLNSQKQAFDYGVKISGCSVHFVDESLDMGPVILQRAVERTADDTLESFSHKILREEHKILSEAIEIVSTGKFDRSDKYINLL